MHVQVFEVDSRELIQQKKALLERCAGAGTLPAGALRAAREGALRFAEVNNWLQLVPSLTAQASRCWCIMHVFG